MVARTGALSSIALPSHRLFLRSSAANGGVTAVVPKSGRSFLHVPPRPSPLIRREGPPPRNGASLASNSITFVAETAARSSAQKALYSSKGHKGTGNVDWNEIENERPEDAMPFNYDNKFTFGLKLFTLCAVGLLAPVGIVIWQM